MQRFAVILGTLLLAACSATAQSSPTPSPAPATHTPAATATPVLNATAIPDPRPEVPAQHAVRSTLDLELNELLVTQNILYTNLGTSPLTELLLLAEAGRNDGHVEIRQVSDGIRSLPYTMDGRMLTIQLPQTLQPGGSQLLTLDFRYRIPPIDPKGSTPWLGSSNRQLNLGNALPVVAARRAETWLVPAVHDVGEQAVQDLANWEVSLVIEDAPAGLVVVGPGDVQQIDAQHWQINASRMRDFTLSVSQSYQIAKSTDADGPDVEVYSLGEAPDAKAAAAWTLEVARRSVNRFSELFGPLALERLAVVEGDFPDGMEFSAVVFVSADWFESWEGEPASYLTVITAHEVAHQWWYASVANNQAEAPWLDEALATYSELLLLEADFPQLVDWWWDWRVNRFAPGGFVDSEVYDFGSRRAYINAVYLQGARLLHALRQDLGDDEFFAWLRRHAMEHAGGIVTAGDLWGLLNEAQLEATRATRSHFLRDPGP